MNPKNEHLHCCTYFLETQDRNKTSAVMAATMPLAPNSLLLGSLSLDIQLCRGNNQHRGIFTGCRYHFPVIHCKHCHDHYLMISQSIQIMLPAFVGLVSVFELTATVAQKQEQAAQKQMHFVKILLCSKGKMAGKAMQAGSI